MGTKDVVSDERANQETAGAVEPPDVHVEDDAPPLTQAVAGSLRAMLADREFSEATAALSGVVALRSASTPQAVSLRLGDGAVRLAHGAADGADMVVTIDLDDPDGGEPELSGDQERHDLSDWLLRLLDPPKPPWPEAARRFWEQASRMPGAPAGLRVVELGSGEELRLGENGTAPYEIHGESAALVRVLTAQEPLIEAAHRGRVYVRGSLPELSVLTGAGFALMLGDDR